MRSFIGWDTLSFNDFGGEEGHVGVGGGGGGEHGLDALGALAEGGGEFDEFGAVGVGGAAGGHGVNCFGPSSYGKGGVFVEGEGFGETGDDFGGEGAAGVVPIDERVEKGLFGEADFLVGFSFANMFAVGGFIVFVFEEVFFEEFDGDGGDHLDVTVAVADFEDFVVKFRGGRHLRRRDGEDVVHGLGGVVEVIAAPEAKGHGGPGVDDVQTGSGGGTGGEAAVVFDVGEVVGAEAVAEVDGGVEGFAVGAVLEEEGVGNADAVAGAGGGAGGVLEEGGVELGFGGEAVNMLESFSYVTRALGGVGILEHVEAGDIFAPVGAVEDAFEAATELQEVHMSLFQQEIGAVGVIAFAFVEVGLAVEDPFVFGVDGVPLGGEVVGLVPGVVDVDGDEVGLQGSDNIVFGFKLEPFSVIFGFFGLDPEDHGEEAAEAAEGEAGELSGEGAEVGFGFADEGFAGIDEAALHQHGGTEECEA